MVPSNASPVPASGGGSPWPGWLADQVDWHWHAQARPRLDGLTDEEYRWEPTPGAWNVRPRDDGEAVIDWTFPPPEPAPLTTIAWRLAHVVVGVLGDRNARYFGGPPIGYDTYAYPLSSARSLADLDAGFARWVAGVRALGEADLRGRCRETGHEQDSMAELVLHINRKLVHHLAEVALLRDLWVHRDD